MKKRVASDVSNIVVLYKLITGLIEFVLGVSILFFGRNISLIYNHYKLSELLEDPHDLLINIIGKITPFFNYYHIYFIVSLIGFGLVKIIAAIGLFYEKEWGLDILVLFFFIFLPFDIYTFLFHPTFLKVLYFLINLLITLYLIEFKPHIYFLKYIKYLSKTKK
jgi:uncharacterized membrane protein (DUF2068 family)